MKIYNLDFKLEIGYERNGACFVITHEIKRVGEKVFMGWYATIVFCRSILLIGHKHFANPNRLKTIKYHNTYTILIVFSFFFYHFLFICYTFTKLIYFLPTHLLRHHRRLSSILIFFVSCHLYCHPPTSSSSPTQPHHSNSLLFL